MIPKSEYEASVNKWVRIVSKPGLMFTKYPESDCGFCRVAEKVVFRATGDTLNRCSFCEVMVPCKGTRDAMLRRFFVAREVGDEVEMVQCALEILEWLYDYGLGYTEVARNEV